MKNYTITYNGIMLTMNRDEVTDQFASLFNIPRARAEAILEHPGTVLRSGLDAVTAEQFREQLLAIGLDIDVFDAVALSKGSWLTNGKPILPEPFPPLELVPMEDAGTDGDRLALYSGNRVLPFECRATASGYFRVWIVNLLLLALTLGAFLPWASNRKREFFYSKTLLANASFGFVGNAKQAWQTAIIGGSFTLALLGFYLGFSRFSLPLPIAAGGLFLLLLLAPAILVMLRSIRMRCVEWRRVRFTFAQDFMGAYRMALLPLLFAAALVGHVISTGSLVAFSAEFRMGAMVSLLLFFPYWQCLSVRYFVSHTGFGRDVFFASCRASDYYKLYYLKVPALLLVLALLAGLVLLVLPGTDMVAQFAALESVLLSLLHAPQEGVHQSVEIRTYLTAFIVLMLVITGFAWVLAYIAANLFNLRYHGATIGKSVVYSNMQATPLLLVCAGNLLAVLLSAGLLIPWASVRLAKFRLANLDFHASYEMEDIVNEARRISENS